MNTKHNTDSTINGVATVWVVEREVLQKPAFLHQVTLNCIDERGRKGIVAVENKGMEATVSLAVSDDLCLILPKMFVQRRRDPANGTVDNLSSDAKLDVRHDSFDYILQPSHNSRAPCKVVDEPAAVGSSVCGKDDIKW